MASAAFEIFLHRARRNWSAWTIAEYAGLGLLGGCCCAVLLLPILLWRNQPGQAVAMIFPMLSMFAGGMVGIRKRPSLREVAQLADDRFHTADLLATALALRGSSEPWHNNILRMADACALGLSPAALTPHRLGGRAWAGIVLTLIAVITLGLFSTTMPLNRAEATAVSQAPSGWEDSSKADAGAPESLQPGQPAAREARAEQTPDSQSASGIDSPAQANSDSAKGDRSSREGQAETGTGEGSARTDTAHVDMPSGHVGSSTGDSITNGAIAPGGEGSQVRAPADGAATAGQVSPKQGDSVAPWSSSTWPAAQAAAMDAVQRGRVPDAYRDLVRDYFQPDDSLSK